ncbi:MAG: hypothetical protein ACYTEU_12910, partial [Planctomycetota bacterium]
MKRYQILGLVLLFIFCGLSYGADDVSPPTPNPAEWKAAPRKIGGSGANVTVAMEASAASDESDVEYRFKETSVNPGGGFTSAWQDNPVYSVSGLSEVAPGYTYSFQVQVRDKSAGQNETAWSTPPAQVKLFPAPQNRYVPSPTYGTIQAAINACNNGDTVIVRADLGNGPGG